MKRLTVWIVSTASGVVLLFSYHTSTSGPAGGRIVAGVAPVGVVAESPGTDPSPEASAAPSRPAAATLPAVAGPKAPTVAVPTMAPARPAASPKAPVSAATTAPPPAPAPKKTTAPTRTINGAAVDTRYGPVQVQIKVRGSRILSSDAIVYPQSEQRDQEINSQAVPQLNDETLQAQSAHIDTVSGATYTSDGYRQSLQSALDAAHLQ